MDAVGPADTVVLLCVLPLVWLAADEEDKRSRKPATPARAVYQQQAEIRGKVDVRKGGFGGKEVEDKASRVSGRGRPFLRGAFRFGAWILSGRGPVWGRVGLRQLVTRTGRRLWACTFHAG